MQLNVTLRTKQMGCTNVVQSIRELGNTLRYKYFIWHCYKSIFYVSTKQVLPNEVTLCIAPAAASEVLQ
jgi:hypothetical protein